MKSMEQETMYVYSTHKTRTAAEQKLEDMFACGEVCEAERPVIRRRSKYCLESNTKCND